MKSQNGLFSSLPASEQSFLIDTSERIISSAGNSIEALLRDVTCVFDDKEYGWEEAILDQTWYRYPSQIKSQRFCSEEALKNYLILKTLGIPAYYCILEKYLGSDMSHEIVLVPENETTYILNWDMVSPAKIMHDVIIPENGPKITFDKIFFLSEDEVLERVSALQAGESLLEAIETGQMIYRKESETGELEAYIKYFPKNNEVNFTFVFGKYAGGIHTYIEHKTYQDEKGIHDHQSFGICSHVRYNTRDKIPFFEYHDGIATKEILSIPDILEKLPEDRLRTILIEAYYDWAILNGLTQEPDHAYTHNERRESIEVWNDVSEDKSCPKDIRDLLTHYIKTYNHYQKYKPEAAEKYVDFRCMMIDFDVQCPSQDDMDTYFLENHNMNKQTLFLFHILNSLSNFGNLLSTTDTLSASDILNEVICSKTNISFTRCNFSGLFNSLAYFREKTPKEIYGF